MHQKQNLAQFTACGN